MYYLPHKRKRIERLKSNNIEKENYFFFANSNIYIFFLKRDVKYNKHILATAIFQLYCMT